MLTGFDRLALEVWDVQPALEFYRDALGIDCQRQIADRAVLDVGDGHTVVLQAPGPVPRGGLHVHYALATSPDQYEPWRDRLAPFDPSEHDFGSTRSVYAHDPDGHCLELATVAENGHRLDGVFEAVLEVEALAPAERFYRELGFEVIDRGDDRRRIRLRGPIDLELWEPQRGIADARGGVHCTLDFTADSLDAVRAAVSSRAAAARIEDEILLIRDPDGHCLRVHPADGSLESER
ncbi:MAG: VOC family protein [Halobacteriaceae archaeon]